MTTGLLAILLVPAAAQASQPGPRPGNSGAHGPVDGQPSADRQGPDHRPGSADRRTPAGRKGPDRTTAAAVASADGRGTSGGQGSAPNRVGPNRAGPNRPGAQASKQKPGGQARQLQSVTQPSNANQKARKDASRNAGPKPGGPPPGSAPAPAPDTGPAPAPKPQDPAIEPRDATPVHDPVPVPVRDPAPAPLDPAPAPREAPAPLPGPSVVVVVAPPASPGTAPVAPSPPAVDAGPETATGRQGPGLEERLAGILDGARRSIDQLVPRDLGPMPEPLARLVPLLLGLLGAFLALQRGIGRGLGRVPMVAAPPMRDAVRRD